MTPSQFLVAVFSAILFMCTTAVLAAPLVLYEDINFRGVRTEVVIARNNTEACVNIRGKLNDFVSSVEAAAAAAGGEEETSGDNCYLLCTDEHCRGRCVPLTVSISDLSTLDINDAVSSIKRCPLSLPPQSLSSSNSSTSTASTAKSTTNLPA